MTLHRPEYAALGLLLYCAALAIVLRWMASRAETLPADDERGFSDEEAAEMRVLFESNDIHGEG